MTAAFVAALALLGLTSFALAPRLREADAFFKGASDRIAPPGLLTLVFSQVTTWIFARSLMTAAILGYYYGIAGALAYAAYYMSFFTGTARPAFRISCVVISAGAGWDATISSSACAC